MTREELKDLSENTFTTNNARQITAHSHRFFNEQLLDSSVQGITLGEDRVEPDPASGIVKFPAYCNRTLCEINLGNLESLLYWYVIGDMLFLMGSVYNHSTSMESGFIIENIPQKYLSRFIYPRLTHGYLVDVLDGSVLTRKLVGVEVDVERGLRLDVIVPRAGYVFFSALMFPLTSVV